MFFQLRQAMLKAGERLISTVGGEVSDAVHMLHPPVKVVELLFGRHFVPSFRHNGNTLSLSAVALLKARPS
jgi:hypothetical protein